MLLQIAWLVKLLEDMVEEGQLTAQEKSSMLEQLGSKVETLDLEISKVTHRLSVPPAGRTGRRTGSLAKGCPMSNNSSAVCVWAGAGTDGGRATPVAFQKSCWCQFATGEGRGEDKEGGQAAGGAGSCSFQGCIACY